MKRIIIIFLLVLFYSFSYSQFYIRGEVKDDKGNYLQNVSILIHSTDISYWSGSSGGFGIPSSRLLDTITFFIEGYEPVTKAINAKEYVVATLKILTVTASKKKNHLTSVIEDINNNDARYWTTANETYSNLVENPFAKAIESPVTSFSANANRASYSNIRRFLNMNERVPPDASIKKTRLLGGTLFSSTFRAETFKKSS